MMLSALTQLLGFQLAGEILTRALGLPLPGPVVGMALLFAVLSWRGGPSPALRETGGTLLQHLSLLFIPAGVGILAHAPRVAAEWQPLLAALLGSTVLTLALTALAMHLLMPRPARGEAP